jgi:hypothetical protein
MGCISEGWPNLIPPCGICELRLSFDPLPVREFKSSIPRPEQCRLEFSDAIIAKRYLAASSHRPFIAALA